MGFLTRALVPRKVRRVAHPVRSVKRAATPKSVKRARRSLHPVSNAGYSITRKLNTKPRRRSPVYRHAGCSVNHRTQEAANKCGTKRTVTTPPVTKPVITVPNPALFDSVEAYGAAARAEWLKNRQGSAEEAGRAAAEAWLKSR